MASRQGREFDIMSEENVSEKGNSQNSRLAELTFLTIQDNCGNKILERADVVVADLKEFLKINTAKQDAEEASRFEAKSAKSTKSHMKPPAEPPAEPPKGSKAKFTLGLSPFPNHLHPTIEEVEVVHAILTDAHGDQVRPAVLKPSLERMGCGNVPTILDAILRTVISANTNIANSDKVLKELIEKFGVKNETVNWEAIEKADRDEVIKAISVGGMAFKKTDHIKAILAMVREECNERNEANLSLEHWRYLETPNLMEKMMQFKGVGVKIAACVVLYCLQRPCLAIDTHCFRLAKLLGWVPHTADAESTFYHLDAAVPDEYKYALHQLFMAHGQSCAKCSGRGVRKEGKIKAAVEATVTMEETKETEVDANVQSKRMNGRKRKNEANIITGTTETTVSVQDVDEAELAADVCVLEDLVDRFVFTRLEEEKAARKRARAGAATNAEETEGNKPKRARKSKTLVKEESFQELIPVDDDSDNMQVDDPAPSTVPVKKIGSRKSKPLAVKAAQDMDITAGEPMAIDDYEPQQPQPKKATKARVRHNKAVVNPMTEQNIQATEQVEQAPTNTEPAGPKTEKNVTKTTRARKSVAQAQPEQPEEPVASPVKSNNPSKVRKGTIQVQTVQSAELAAKPRRASKAKMPFAASN